MTTAEVATDRYARRAEQLQVMARYCDARGDKDQAKRCRASALIAFAAGRAEARNPINPPVQCGICLRASHCDIDVHLARRRTAG